MNNENELNVFRRICRNNENLVSAKIELSIWRCGKIGIYAWLFGSLLKFSVLCDWCVYYIIIHCVNKFLSYVTRFSCYFHSSQYSASESKQKQVLVIFIYYYILLLLLHCRCCNVLEIAKSLLKLHVKLDAPELLQDDSKSNRQYIFSTSYLQTANIE
jgi:hypothetical protein